jgi:hypothetical protein
MMSRGRRLGTLASVTRREAMADLLASWRDTATKRAIVDFVHAVTDPSSPECVPEADRVAVFDNDGTLATEMPYTQLAFALDRAAELGHPTTAEELQAGGMPAVLELFRLTHGSVTTHEFDAAVQAWIATARHPRFGRSFAEMVYQPMLELLALLEVRGFTCWVVSGGGVDFMRAWAPDVYGIPAHQLIGSSGTVEYRVGNAGPEFFKGTDLAILDDGPQKPISIHQYVAKRPLLAAGNTDGDVPMLQWTAASPYRSLELVIHHTDADREFAYDKDPVLGSGTDQLLAAAAGGTWTVVDMATDWATIYPPED